MVDKEHWKHDGLRSERQKENIIIVCSLAGVLMMIAIGVAKFMGYDLP